MGQVSVYRGYTIHNIGVDPGWAARKVPAAGVPVPEGTPFDLAATSFDEMQAEIDAAVEIEEALEKYLGPKEKRVNVD